MDDLYKESGENWPSFIDHKLCDDRGGEETGGAACNPQQWKVKGGGNTNLTEERSLSANIGVVFQAMENFSLGLDAWYINLNNQVGIDYEDVTKAEKRFGADYLKGFGY